MLCNFVMLQKDPEKYEQLVEQLKKKDKTPKMSIPIPKRRELVEAERSQSAQPDLAPTDRGKETPTPCKEPPQERSYSVH